jgi:hypothetical protein
MNPAKRLVEQLLLESVGTAALARFSATLENRGWKLKSYGDGQIELTKGTHDHEYTIYAYYFNKNGTINAYSAGNKNFDQEDASGNVHPTPTPVEMPEDEMSQSINSDMSEFALTVEDEVLSKSGPEFFPNE